METEFVPNTFPSLFWGYTAIWCLIAAYVASIAKRLARLEKNSTTNQPRPSDIP